MIVIIFKQIPSSKVNIGSGLAFGSLTTRVDLLIYFAFSYEFVQLNNFLTRILTLRRYISFFKPSPVLWPAITCHCQWTYHLYVLSTVSSSKDSLSIWVSRLRCTMWKICMFTDGIKPLSFRRGHASLFMYSTTSIMGCNSVNWLIWCQQLHVTFAPSIIDIPEVRHTSLLPSNFSLFV